jgi:type VI secretion system protein ImpG
MVERGGKDDWEKLSCIIFNLSGMLWQNGDFPLSMFKTMLKSYSRSSADETERMLAGVIALKSESGPFRFYKRGAVFFEWGWKLALLLDEDSYAGIGVYIFARLIWELLSSLSPINTPLEMTVSTKQSGQIGKWKTLEET